MRDRLSNVRAVLAVALWKHAYVREGEREQGGVLPADPGFAAQLASQRLGTVADVVGELLDRPAVVASSDVDGESDEVLSVDG